MIEYHEYYADGRWRPATGATQLIQRNPTSELAQSLVTVCSPADVALAVSVARRCAPGWAQSPLDERRRALGALHRAIAKRADAFVNLLATELGVPVWVGRTMQLPMPLANLERIIEGLDQITWHEQIGNAAVAREPVGVIAAITPWNFPLHQIIAKLAGAIGAGCPTVLKPSEVAPGVARLLLEAVAEADLPPGLVNMVWGGADVGECLVASPGVDLVTFTGSTAVGRRIMVTAAASLTRVLLELGGKSASLVLEDADLDAAIPATVRRCMVNSGQTCVAQSRLLVPRKELAAVIQRVVAALAEWTPGDPTHTETRIGPLATPSQFGSVNQHIRQAITDGATLIAGGAGRAAGFERGFFVTPTAFSDVTAEMALAKNEVFGPVLAVMPYDSEADGIALANETPYGLSGGVWSTNPARAEAAARRIRAGQVILNGAPSNYGAPFGGFGQSGFGRENGRFSIEAFLEWKSMPGLTWPA